MSEYKTLQEWFGGATRGDGRKFTRMDWLENQWIEPIYLDKHKDWHCLDYEEYSRAWGSELYPFKEWHPPKKKVTKYLFATKCGELINNFYTDYEQLWESYNTDITSISKIKETHIRLDWSATEFDDE